MSHLNKYTTLALAAVIGSLGLSQSARAAVVVQGANGGTETVGNGTYDVINFTLASLTGADAGSSIILLGPAAGSTYCFTATNGGSLGVPGNDTAGSAANYTNFLTPNGNAVAFGRGFDSTFVNLDNIAGPARSGTGTGTVSTGTRPVIQTLTGNSNQLGVSWFTTNPTGITVGNLVAQVLVTPGGGVSFNGVVTTANGASNVAPLTFAFSPNATTAPLISLTTAAPTGFGSQLGTLALTGGNGSYRSATVTFATPQTTGYVAVTGFNPGTDTEVYGLRILVNGATPDATTLGTIIGDINATGGNTDTNGTVTAATNTGAFASQFPTSNLLLTTAGTTNGNPFLGFNFANVPGVTGTVTVASISAVPEPTSVAALAVGAVGLLGSRRRAKRTA